MRHTLALLMGGALVAVLGTPMVMTGQATSSRFFFGSGKLPHGYVRVTPQTAYGPTQSFGFGGGLVETPVANDPGAEDFCSSTPFFFSLDEPEGDYNVTVTLGDRGAASETTLKAEARRLILEDVKTSPGQFVTETFTVNVRHNVLKSGGTVRLKRDEQPHLDWDNRLTLEFNNAHPCVKSLQIRPAGKAITIYIAGDSTVTDQGKEPWAAWGQMLPRFFKPGVAVDNIAESGETLKSFIGERRFEKISDTIHAGDYLFIQFAHNDQKPGRSHVDPFTSYEEYLQRFIDLAHSRGATPVLVTSMNRRTFGPDGKIYNSLGDYPAAMRQLAQKDHVALIDLNAMSKEFYDAMGPEESRKAFVQYPAGTFPGQVKELKDNTHFNNYGAYELAKCIVEGIKADRLGLTKFLRNDTPAFDPAHPDPFAEWKLPRSPVSTVVTPQGH